LSFEPEMILIPDGEFLMGDELKKVHLSDYYIARTPITNAQYLRFVRAGGKCPDHWWGGKISVGKEHHPVVNVSWHEATAYCNWLSRITDKYYRLPTDQEWEKAARGTDGREYPWGDEPPNKSLCNFGMNVEDTTPVGKYSPDGDSPYGCTDMAGNVWEWTDSWVDEGQNTRVLRGGSFHSYPRGLYVARRGGSVPDVSNERIGFRCCLAAQ
jgi:serine/threonine-protein kinase